MDKSELTRLKELAERAEANDFGQITASYSNKAYAEFAAAANPQTILAMIDEIERLEEDLDIRFQDNRVLKNQNERVARINMGLLLKNQQLNKEADWLATYLADTCSYVPDIENCPINEAIGCPCGKCRCASKPAVWREAARKAVEESTLAAAPCLPGAI